jgi:hypothetical protein
MLTDVSEVLITLMIQLVNTSETSSSTLISGTVSQNDVIFILAAFENLKSQLFLLGQDFSFVTGDQTSVCLEQCKGKGKFVPVPNHHAMKMYGEVKANLHAFLTFTLDGGGPSRSSRFVSVKEPLYHLLSCRLASTERPDLVTKIENSLPAWNETSTVQPIGSHFPDVRNIAALMINVCSCRLYGRSQLYSVVLRKVTESY